MCAQPVYSRSTERKKVEAEKAAAQELWQSNKVKETRQGSESHDLGINGLSTARGILQRFREVCQSTKRDAETDIQQGIGTWPFRSTVRGRVPDKIWAFSATTKRTGWAATRLSGWRTHFWEMPVKLLVVSESLYFPSFCERLSHIRR